MKLSDFDYTLPKELIAQYPLRERDSARLLVLERDKGKIEHRIFKDTIEYLKKEDLLVLNDTKVLPARIMGRRLSGGKVEFLLLERQDNNKFKALIKPGNLKSGEKIVLNGSKTFALVTGKQEVSFPLLNIDEIYSLGRIPLPPYIKREPEDLDAIYYQTVYAQKKGAKAAPTAGLHFTKEILQKIKRDGVKIATLTLHVGYGTFKPVKSEKISEHKMEREYFQLGKDTIDLIKQTQVKKGRIIAVGTTSCRALETYANGQQEGDTDLFIYPGYKFKITDCLLTNFHLPKTTLFMLVSAFAGEKLIKKAYQEAIEKKYRFYSYGDAMLII